MKKMKINIKLGQTKLSHLEAMANVEHYNSNMQTNPLFQAQDIVDQLAKVNTSFNTLHNSIIAPYTENKTNNVNAARDDLNREVTDLKNKVQGIANKPGLSDEERLGITHAAGMSDKTKIIHSARIFKVLNGDISGTVILLARGGAVSNNWQYTTDIKEFTGRITIDGTSKASTEVSGLPIKTDVAFFHQPVFRGVKSNWEGPVIITVL
jgi:hypothetical protein